MLSILPIFWAHTDDSPFCLRPTCGYCVNVKCERWWPTNYSGEYSARSIISGKASFAEVSSLIEHQRLHVVHFLLLLNTSWFFVLGKPSLKQLWIQSWSIRGWKFKYARGSTVRRYLAGYVPLLFRKHMPMRIWIYSIKYRDWNDHLHSKRVFCKETTFTVKVEGRKIDKTLSATLRTPREPK